MPSAGHRPPQSAQVVPHAEIVRTEFGWAIRFTDPNTETRYTPPSLQQAKRAVAIAESQNRTER